MTYRINEQEIKGVLALSGQGRYEHFIKRIADWEELWGLKDNNGWVTSEDDDGNKSIPFWPHPEYAKLCAEGQWKGNEETSIDLKSFIEKWLPGMEQDNLLVAVFPTPSGKSVYVQPSCLRENIEEELEQYE